MSDKNAESTAINKINTMYKSLKYTDVYGGSVFLFFFITIVVVFVVGYCHIMKQAEHIRSDWVNQRCSPFVIPFAGFINKNPGTDQTVLQFTEDNFQYCIQNMTKEATSFQVQPLTFLTSTLSTLYQGLAEIFNNIRTVISNIRSNMADIATEIYGRIANILIPLQAIMMKTMDFFQKVQGILTAGLMTVFASFMTLQSLIGVIIKVVIFFLIIAAGVIVATWIAMYFNPTMMLILMVPMILATETFALVAVIIASIIIAANSILHMNNKSKVPGVPTRPSCFAPEQLVTMQDRTTKAIKDVEVGDFLWPDNRVTAVLRLNGWGSKVYDLEDILVSGTHRVMYKDKWIYVRDHPDAQCCHMSRFPLLICLNTESKRIDIDGHIFCDWDEIFDEEQRRLFSLLPESKRENRFLHAFFDRGWSGHTLIEMEYGEKKKIEKVEIGEILKGGAVVEGTVTILTEDLENIHHLLTDSASLLIDNRFYEDYNSCIESHL